jgi:hypothetical protein
MTATIDRPARNGTAPPAPAGLRVAGRKRRRPAWVAAGVMIVFGSGLAMALWASSLSDRVSVLAVAREIPAGERIDPGDLRLVDVAAGSGLVTMPASSRADVVGELATVTIPAGALLQPAHVDGTSAIPAGFAVVGVSLRPGAMPVGDLGVGDRVLVVDAGQEDARELAEATVFAVRPDPSSAAATVVSLLVPESQATEVAQSGALEQVQLVLVSQGGAG